jgi:hypothetical protein
LALGFSSVSASSTAAFFCFRCFGPSSAAGIVSFVQEIRGDNSHTLSLRGFLLDSLRSLCDSTIAGGLLDRCCAC